MTIAQFPNKPLTIALLAALSDVLQSGRLSQTLASVKTLHLSVTGSERWLHYQTLVCLLVVSPLSVRSSSTQPGREETVLNVPRGLLLVTRLLYRA